MSPYRNDLAKNIKEIRNKKFFSIDEKKALLETLGAEKTDNLEKEKTNHATKKLGNMLHDGKNNEQYKKQKIERQNTIISDNDTDNQYIDIYKREKELAEKLNQQYYNTNEGGFWGGFNSFYDTGSIIFAKSTGSSKIFLFDQGKLIDTNKTYRDITKIGNIYIGTTIESKDTGKLKEKIDGSEQYFLIDQKGKEKNRLRGNISFLDEENIYIESFYINNNAYYCLYDYNFEKVIDNIPKNNAILGQHDGNILFVNNNTKDNKKYILHKKGDTRSENYKDINDDDIKDIYAKYISKQQSTNEQKNTIPLYTISYKENTRYIAAIYDTTGKEVFDTQGKNYCIAYGSDSHNGIFLLYGIDDDNNRYIEDIFINIQQGVSIKFKEMCGSTYIHGKVLKHFINHNDSELYNIDTGEKLGESISYRDNEHHFQIVARQGGKKNLIENKTGTCVHGDFDKILKVYNHNTEKVVIVENQGKIIDIHIQK